jgi:hypothetical protein
MNENPQKPTIWTKLRDWVQAHRTRSIIILGAALVVIACGIVYAFWPQSVPKTVVHTAPKPKAPPPVFYSPLTGEKVADEAATKMAVTAIMLENSPDTRPQSGVKQAGIVYEAIAEGGITRFLTLHQQDKPQMIGPVRSLRMYYVDWLAPYNASVAHVGGSFYSLQEIRSGKYRDIDQFFNGASYWRATDRYAPHNVYTSFEKLDALNAAKGYTTSAFTAWPRADGKPVETPNASSVTINFGSAAFNTAYTYDKASNHYNRSVGGALHLDREDGQITPTVVIAMKVEMTRIFEDGYREDIKAIGSGQAYIFQNGTVQEVTWSKPARENQITFTDASGKEVPLARGQTWVSAIPTTTGSVSWQ